MVNGGFREWLRSYGALAGVALGILTASITAAQTSGRNEQRITGLEATVDARGRLLEQVQRDLSAARADLAQVRADIGWIRRRLER